MTVKPLARRAHERVRSTSLLWPLAGACLVALSYAPTACSSGSDGHPPGVGTSGGSGNAGSNGEGARAGTTTGGSVSAAAGAADTGSAGDNAAGGAGPTYESDAGPGRPAPGPAACSETAAWSGSTKVDVVSTATADEVLLSVTADELDLAFLRAGALYVAHRAEASASFTVGDAVTIPAGWNATQGAALSPDGKRLVLISTSQDTLGELTRSARDAAFSGSVDETAFATVNLAATYTANIFASPTISPDDQELFLNSAVTGGASTIVVATRSAAGDVWGSPSHLSGALDGTDTTRRLPTGVSADARTLFYFNEESMKQEARWRDTPSLTSPLYDMVDLGTRRGAQPNTGCDRLYSQATGDVVVEHD
jgi:hypothetical protein